MDCLNEVLKTLHLKSSVSCRSELSAPWGLAFPHVPGHAGFSVVGPAILGDDTPHVRA